VVIDRTARSTVKRSINFEIEEVTASTFIDPTGDI
jgi:hypothetical protein